MIFLQGLELSCVKDKSYKERLISGIKLIALSTKEYKKFLGSIGYLETEGPDFSICTENVDHEIASLSGPQLVVPLKNARFAINAANARWGSLYDALYGSDVIIDGEDQNMMSGYCPVRGEKVISYARTFLD